MLDDEWIEVIVKTSEGPKIQEKRRGMFAEEKSAGRQEFYAAYEKGLFPRKVFKVDRLEYESCIQKKEDGEVFYPSELIHKGIRYQIIREFAVNADKVEVTCG